MYRRLFPYPHRVSLPAVSALPREKCHGRSGHRNSYAHIAQVTGPLALLAKRRLLVIVDDENLSISARNLGYNVSYTALGTLLSQRARSCALHAVFSRPQDDTRRIQYFSAHGWTPHTRHIERYRTSRGMAVHANADHLLSFTAGILASRSDAEIIVLGSGDGNLVCDIATAIGALPKKRMIVSMSLAGSTSYRLDATTNARIAANIEIGLDALHPRRR